MIVSAYVDSIKVSNYTANKLVYTLFRISCYQSLKHSLLSKPTGLLRSYYITYHCSTLFCVFYSSRIVQLLDIRGSSFQFSILVGQYCGTSPLHEQLIVCLAFFIVVLYNKNALRYLTRVYSFFCSLVLLDLSVEQTGGIINRLNLDTLFIFIQTHFESSFRLTKMQFHYSSCGLAQFNV